MQWIQDHGAFLNSIIVLQPAGALHAMIRLVYIKNREFGSMVAIRSAVIYLVG